MKIFVPLFLDDADCKIYGNWLVQADTKIEAHAKAELFLKKAEKENFYAYVVPNQHAWKWDGVEEIKFQDGISML